MDDVQLDLAESLWSAADGLLAFAQNGGVKHPSAVMDMTQLSVVLHRIGDCVMEGTVEGAGAQALADAVAKMDLPVSDFPMIGGK